MHCPLCYKRSRVLESRPAEGGAAVRRRRECASCGHRFTSFERLAPSPAIVCKRDGRREELDAAKLRAGLERAAHKLPEAERAVERIVAAVELEAAGSDELSTRRIGEICLAGLREADQVAYLRFATVHKQLADTEAIRIELSALDLADAEAALARASWPAQPSGPAGSAPLAGAPLAPSRAHDGAANSDFTERPDAGDPADSEHTEPGREIHA